MNTCRLILKGDIEMVATEIKIRERRSFLLLFIDNRQAAGIHIDSWIHYRIHFVFIIFTDMLIFVNSEDRGLFEELNLWYWMKKESRIAYSSFILKIAIKIPKMRSCLKDIFDDFFVLHHMLNVLFFLGYHWR